MIEIRRRNRKQQTVQELYHVPGSRQFNQQLWRLAASFALAAILLAANSAGARAVENQLSQPQSAEKIASAGQPSIVAWINTTPIYSRDVERGILAKTGGKKVDTAKLPMMQATVLDELIEKYLMAQYLDTSKFQPSSAELDAAVDSFSKRLQERKQSLKEYLQQNKQSEATLRKQLAEGLSLNKYVEQNCTDDALQKYFVDNQQLFDGTQRRVSHILLRPVGMFDDAARRSLIAQAAQLRGRIVTGELTFESAAEKYSDGPSRFHGGDLGFIPRQGGASAQFSAAAFALKPDEISPPVLDSFGVHLIRVTDLKPGEKTWKESKDALKAAYSQELVEQLMADLRSKAKIEFFDAFPHFIPGTHDLAPAQPVGLSP